MAEAEFNVRAGFKEDGGRLVCPVYRAGSGKTGGCGQRAYCCYDLCHDPSRPKVMIIGS
jgi:hypothetical protein